MSRSAVMVSVAGAIVLNIAVWGAVLAYFLQMVSFIILRRKFPNAERPYLSPWGITGAVIAAAIALLIFVGFLLNPTFLPAIIAIGIVDVVLLAGFAFFFRHRLVLSPEEEFAMSHGAPAHIGGGLEAAAQGPQAPPVQRLHGPDRLAEDQPQHDRRHPDPGAAEVPLFRAARAVREPPARDQRDRASPATRARDTRAARPCGG